MNEGFALGIGKCSEEDVDKAIDEAMKSVEIFCKAMKRGLKEIKGATEENAEGSTGSEQLFNDVMTGLFSGLDSTENRSPFHATVEGMLSADYRERFKAEYQQTKIRYEKLKAFNNRIEAAKISKKTGMPAHDCPDTILRAQQAAMGEYLHILEVRAEIENIKL